ncbi:MAG: hypothetical protein Q7S74_05000 [Nanoarchaeota archaeon]|nr:hypothetical protein [Nanoarchaeota archaeon]
MPKRGKSKSSSSGKKRLTNSQIQEKLIQNMVELQKVHADLAVKFDSLAKEISNLLSLFEVAAKNLAGQTPMRGEDRDKDFLDKVDKLLEQNKVIAKGLTLMEERIREKSSIQQETMQPSINSPNRPLPRF